MAKPIRIQKVLGDAGILSRRKTEEYIRAGRITVNGHPAQPGNPVNPDRDLIAIDGRRVILPRRKENLYLMLNKPRGYVTTTSDELGRRCVTQLVEDAGARVYPVGRLDRDSEGLLLLTNDGQFANLIMHPSHHVSKTYRVTVRPDITEDILVALSAGVEIGEGEVTQPAVVHVLEKQPGRVVLQMTISEGKNRQIRRMCEAVGLEVVRLKRISVGPLKLGMLQPGQWRELKKSEVIALRNAAKPASQQEPLPREEDAPVHLGSFGSGTRRGARPHPAKPAPDKKGSSAAPGTGTESHVRKNAASGGGYGHSSGKADPGKKIFAGPSRSGAGRASGKGSAGKKAFPKGGKKTW